MGESKLVSWQHWQYRTSKREAILLRISESKSRLSLGLSYKRKRGPTGACKCPGSKVMPDPTHNSRTLDSRGSTTLVALAARATALMRASSIFQTLLSPLFLFVVDSTAKFFSPRTHAPPLFFAHAVSLVSANQKLESLARAHFSWAHMPSFLLLAF